ncbi:MAG TPA: cation transporter [Sphaerochaeta sp.]|nr:cation transporter [Sphaerochaeta sp.]
MNATHKNKWNMSNKKTELLLLRVTTAVCLAFGIVSVVASFKAHSNSMLFDGLYSLIQSMFILGSAGIVSLLFRKENREFQFGYSAFEPFFIVIRSTVMLLMTFSIAASALRAILTGGYAIDVGIALKINILSLVVCLIAYGVLALQAKRLKSPVLQVEARSWLIDSAISLAAVLAMILIFFANKKGYTKLALYIDPIVTVFFIIGLSPMLVTQLLQSSRELLGAAPASSIQKDLEHIAKRHVKREGLKNSKIFAVQQGRSLSVTLYFYLKEERSLRELDSLRAKILQDLRTYSSWVEADVVFTIDPSWVPLAMPLAVATI